VIIECATKIRERSVVERGERKLYRVGIQSGRSSNVIGIIFA
jgi:hypothetical protein